MTKLLERLAFPCGQRVETIGGPRILEIGCGAVGTVIARHLCASEAIGGVTVADVDPSASKRAAAVAGSDKAHVLTLDASDPEQLRRAMRDHDVVVNASLPRFNRGIKEVAVAAGTHYLDLATESSDPFVDDTMWRDHGLTALLGMGEDPGLSDVCARKVADGMDRVESIRVRDGDTGSSPEFPFVATFSPESFVEETTTPSRVWKDGAYEIVPPFGAEERFEFPAPLGPLTVYSVDHEEVDSLPRFIGKGVRYVDFKLAIDAPTKETLRQFQEARSRARTPEALAQLRRAFFSKVPKPAELGGKLTGDSGFVVEVTGIAKDRRVVHTLHTILGHQETYRRQGTTATAYLTGTGAAAGALLLATGQVKERGVLAPECLDPDPVLRWAGARGVKVTEHVRTLAPA